MAGRPAATDILSNPLLGDFGNAMRSAALGRKLNFEPGMTVFAPDDEAFARLRAKLGDDWFHALMDNPHNLGSIVRHAVVDSRLNHDELAAAGTVVALDGDRLTVGGSGTSMTVADETGPTARVVCGNIPTENATLFITDTVLISPESLFAHVAAPERSRCAPNPNAHDDAVLCFDAVASAARLTPDAGLAAQPNH